MASDGPSKPLVPPPPTLGGTSGSTPHAGDAASTPKGDGASAADDAWLALIDDEAEPPQQVESEDSEELQTVAIDPQTSADERVPEALDAAAPAAEVEAEPEADEPPPPPQPRRGVLPPPRSEGKRVQPLAAKSSRARGPQRASATGLPSGMRPPGAPEEREHENTDVLIASAVAALTHDAEGEAASDGPAAAASQSSAAASVAAAPSAVHTDEERSKKGLWLGIVALAAAVVLLAVVASGDDETPAQDADPGESSAAAVVSKPDGSDAPAAEASPEPVDVEEDEPVAVALADALDVGGDAEVDLSDALDVGDEVGLAQALDVGSLEADEGEGETDAVDEDTEDANAGRSTKRRKSSRSQKRKDEAKPAKASAKPEGEPDAAELLAAAQKALRAGQSRKAYSLASKSRRAKKSSDALVVMARAACRFGSESQAKSAFDKLTIGDRRGIRAECRDHGVRLGL